jgi:hypothetical protein
VVALMRYWLAVLLHSQRYFPPLLLFVTGVVVLTDNDTGRLTAMYGACSAVLFLSALWLTVGLIQVDDPVQRAITVVNARSSARVLTAAVLVAVSCCVLCLVFGLVFPLLSGSHQVSADAVAVGAISQLGAGMTGIAVGLLCSRPIVRRPAASVALAIILAIVAYVSTWASPLNGLLRLMSSDRTPVHLLGPVGVLAGAGALLLIAVTALTHVVATRRD